MVWPLLKSLLVPGGPIFLILALIPGVALLYRRKDGGRAGRIWVTLLVSAYLVLSVPVTAVLFVRLLSPSYPPVRTVEDARAATAIVVLGAGIHTYRSRGDIFSGSNREYGLRMLEAVRVYRVLEHPWVIVSGALGNERITEAHHMALELTSLGIDPHRIIEEGKASNTREHVLFVPPILRERGVTQFVLVTSQQHITRALRAFQKAGWNPVPSTPEFFTAGDSAGRFAPSGAALEVSSAMIYDTLAMVYYWLRGWI